MSDKKFVNLPNHPGIRKNVTTGRYQALKKIKGKQFSETFDSLRSAIHWKNTFNGVREKSAILEKKTSTFGEVWQKMQELHFPTIQLSTRQVWLKRFFHLENLVDRHMEDFSPSMVSEWIEEKKALVSTEDYKFKVGGGAKYRCNLHNEINLISMIFNWYRAEKIFEEESRTVFNPLRPRHRTQAVIRDTPKKAKHKKIPPEDAFKFFSAIKNEVYRDLAITQYFAAGRVGEISGIQIRNIDLERNSLKIAESCVWDQTNKTFLYLKPLPKNYEPREVYLHPELKAVIERRLKLAVPGCDYLFHIEGKPLNYALIQINYRTAQKRSGITYTGTHCLRHGMATLARRVGGSLDATMAMTGHKDRKLADHYSEAEDDLQKTTSLKVMDHLRGMGLSTSGTLVEKPVMAAPVKSEGVMMDEEMQRRIAEFAEQLVREKQSKLAMEVASKPSDLDESNVVQLFKPTRAL